MLGYFNGNSVDQEDIRISPDDRGFLFADGLYEVIRGAARRTHAFPDPPVGLTFYARASRLDPGPARRKQKQGIHAITVPDIRWARCDMKTTGLTANILANQTAMENGADEAVFVRDGVMLEGTRSNYMAVFDGVLVTAPLSNYILGGVTRKFVLELCETEKIRVREGPVFEKDIHLASELMIVGTISEITPIVRLNHKPIREGVPGPVTGRLQAAFARVIEAL